MRFYLKYINPLVALSILGLCTWIWLGHYFLATGKGADISTAFDKGLSPFNLDSVFHIYFFAKGLFGSSIVFIVGHAYLSYLNRANEKNDAL